MERQIDDHITDRLLGLPQKIIDSEHQFHGHSKNSGKVFLFTDENIT